MKKLLTALKYVLLAVSSRAGDVGGTDSAAELGQLSRDQLHCPRDQSVSAVSGGG